MSRFPFPTTFVGWYQVAYSDELAAGTVLTLRCFGTELVAFRDHHQAPRVIAAHCPHLGAHLGVGGTVEEGAVRCPFHGWRIGGDGACISIPYADKIPPAARARAFPTCERHGMIFAWYHPDNAPPAWEVPEWPEPGGDAFHPYERRRWRIKTHIHELGENVVDGAHFLEVHKARSQPETQVECDGAHLRCVSTMKQATPRGLVEATIEAHAFGLGLWTLRFTGIVETLFVHTATPIDDEHVDVRFSFMVSKAGGASPQHGVGAALIADVVHQVDQDIPIWENKIFRAEPPWCAGEGALTRYRKWARQFYAQ